MQAATYAPSETFADVVLTYWSGSWNLRDQPPHTTELLSDPSVNLVCEAGDGQAGSRLVGVWTRLWRRVLAGKGNVRGMKLRPGGVRAFVDVPAHRFANRVVPLEELFPRDARELERRVLESDDEEGFAAFEDWLDAHRIREGKDSVTLAMALVDRIADNPELNRVENLAREAGLTVRSLQRLFRDYVGVSPKLVIRRFRLQEAALRIERRDAPSLAELAAELGYTDQAHLARDFKNVVGKSPTEFAHSLDL